MLPESFQGRDQPVLCVDWYQAKVFAEWVGGRLPSEAEWEYAARSGGKDRKYPWGHEEATCARAVMDDGGLGCGRRSTWPACSKTAGSTEQGLCDMSGNAKEWTQDVMHDSYDDAPADGSAWEVPPDFRRVFRGGALYSAATGVRSAYRTGQARNWNSDNLGIRVVR